MKKMISFIKTTIIGGLFFIIPIFLVIYLTVKIVVTFRKLVAPLADKINVSFFGEEIGSRVIAVVLLIILCFIAGIFARAKKAIRLKDWFEDHILSNIPGYTLIKGMTEAAAGLDSKHLKEVVLVNLEEVWQIGFLVERIDEQLTVVFIPSAPNPMAGDVVIVKWDRLKMLDIGEISVIKLYRKLGCDSKKILKGKLNIAMFEK